MSITKHKLNKRKNALELLKRKMKKQGFEYKKTVKNTVVFRCLTTDKKLRVNLEY